MKITETKQDKQEIKEPLEYKSYKPKPLITFVYALNKNNEPISYQRIYSQGYQDILKIEQAVNDFYNENGDYSKLNVAKLEELTEISSSFLSSLLVRMASVKRVIERFEGKIKILRDKPYIILQQKHKHISRELFGRRCPLYIFPFAPKYYAQKIKSRAEDEE